VRRQRTDSSCHITGDLVVHSTTQAAAARNATLETIIRVGATDRELLVVWYGTVNVDLYSAVARARAQARSRAIV